MKVFKTCVKVTKRHLLILSLYLVIFTTMLLVFTGVMSSNSATQYEPSQTKIALINRDGDSPLLTGLRDFLAEKGELIPLEDDETALKDALIYGEIQYAVIIPDGFTDAFLAGEPVQAETMAVKMQASSVFCEQFVNQYFTVAEMYVRAGMDHFSDLSTVMDDHAAVELRQYTGVQEVSSYVHVFYGMFGYVMTALMILSTSTIMMAFKRRPVRQRINCAPVRPASVNLQIAAFLGLTALAYTAFMTLIALIPMITGNQLPGGKQFLLLTINTVCLAFISLSISFLCGLFIKNVTVQNAVANFTALILSFLGGIFVPTALLSEQILTVSKFTPLYWYANAIQRITELTDFSSASLGPVFASMAIELAFAAVFLLLALWITRQRKYTRNIQKTKTP